MGSNGTHTTRHFSLCKVKHELSTTWVDLSLWVLYTVVDEGRYKTGTTNYGPVVDNGLTRPRTLHSVSPLWNVCERSYRDKYDQSVVPTYIKKRTEGFNFFFLKNEGLRQKISFLYVCIRISTWRKGRKGRHQKKRRYFTGKNLRQLTSDWWDVT